MNLKREKRHSWETPTPAAAATRPETEWKCNCKARHLLGAGRGRRNPGRIPRNIRHQQHCAELENIRERVREKQERRQQKFRERAAGKKSAKTEEFQPGRKRRWVDDDKDNSDSEDEKCNGGLRMFQGTIVMMKQRELKLLEKSKASVPPTPPSCVDLVNYQEDQQSDDEEAPTEVKTVVSYENTLEEEKSSEVSKEPPLVKRPRKKKKKTGGSSNPPIPGEEDQEPEDEMDNIAEEDPDIPQEKPEEIPEESRAAAGGAETCPAVFRKRLRQPTLLEKLLLSEIKKERNTILQCIRYVCKNNFFQQ